LEIHSAAISWGNHVRNQAQRDDDGAESAKIANGLEGGDEERALRGFIGGGVGFKGGDACGEADADEEGQGKGGDETDEGERKEFVGRGGGRVVDKIVGCASSVCDGCGEAEGEEGYSLGRAEG